MSATRLSEMECDFMFIVSSWSCVQISCWLWCCVLVKATFQDDFSVLGCSMYGRYVLLQQFANPGAGLWVKLFQ